MMSVVKLVSEVQNNLPLLINETFQNLAYWDESFNANTSKLTININPSQISRPSFLLNVTFNKSSYSDDNELLHYYELISNNLFTNLTKYINSPDLWIGFSFYISNELNLKKCCNNHHQHYIDVFRIFHNSSFLVSVRIFKDLLYLSVIIIIIIIIIIITIIIITIRIKTTTTIIIIIIIIIITTTTIIIHSIMYCENFLT
jgi:hypothetical protein